MRDGAVLETWVSRERDEEAEREEQRAAWRSFLKAAGDLRIGSAGAAAWKEAADAKSSRYIPSHWEGDA